MTCKNCGNDVPETSKYCPHCGEKFVKRGRPSKKEETVSEDAPKEEKVLYWEREDATESSKIQYRDDVEREYNYSSSVNSNATTIQYANKNEEPIKRNPCSIISLALFVLALISLYFFPYVSIPLGIASLVLGIVGKKHASRALGGTALGFSIFGFIVVLVVSPILIVGKIELTIAPGEKISIFEYFGDAFYSAFNEDMIYGDWTTEEGNLFSLRQNGTYYLYLDPNNTSDNYYVGSYDIEDGFINVLNNTQFADDEYYYYTLKTYDAQIYSEGQSGRDTSAFCYDTVIKIKIDDPEQAVLSIPRANIKVSMKRAYLEF